MQPELKGSWRSRWFHHLEALLLLCLALHGAMILISAGRPGDWLVVALVFALAGWAFLQPAPGTRLVAVRAAGALIAAWTLCAVSGGPGSLFTLWFFALSVVYPLLLPLRFVTALPIVSTLLYISLGATPGSPLPWSVTLSQALLIALVGGAALLFRRRRDEQVASRTAGSDEQLRQTRTDRLAALDRLARGVAHDFNNLFTVIAGQIALAQGNVNRQEPTHDHLENAKTAVEEAIALSRRLQISSSRTAWEMEAISPNALIESQLPERRESAPAGVQLRFELSGDLPDLRGDPAALRILLREVISHRAAAFGGKDGALTIRTSRKQLPENDAGSGRYTGYAPDAGEYVELAIEDNAESLDDMRLETLFDPYQENSSGARGLSLAMVLGIVRSHQGGLAVTSAAHLGNTFTFLFPAFQDDNGIAIAPAVADVAARRSTLRLILLVSADLSLRNGLERALDDPALRVMAATDSTRAAALYAEFANSVELVVINSEPALDSESDLVAELLSRNARLPIIVIGGPGANFPTIWDVTYLSPSVALSEMAAAVHAALARNSSPGD